VASAAALFVILVVNGVWGLTSANHSQDAVNGWPIASYPSFAGVGADTDEVVRLYERTGGKGWQAFAFQSALPLMPADRLAGLLGSIMARRREDRARTLAVLLGYIRKHSARAARYTQFLVVRDRIGLDPEHPGRVLDTSLVLRLYIRGPGDRSLQEGIGRGVRIRPQGRGERW